MSERGESGEETLDPGDWEEMRALAHRAALSNHWTRAEDLGILVKAVRNIRANPQFSPACLLRLVIAGGSGVALYFPLGRVYSPSPAGRSARALLPPTLPAPRDDIW